ncbi:Dps family protein [Paenibacillus silviterrae]|uniref:Dps family protein n=1 Tax=Paenibacillus silviterrae TaxID=3242194 RepID=UPI002542770D|nr:Dps family protein [Paenibacillus chinjuensis]
MTNQTLAANQVELNRLLNRQVANWAVLYIKIHQYHWFVKGAYFFQLHTKFEELYQEADRFLDELAERVLALGGIPFSTMREFMEAASIREDSHDLSAERMVIQLTDDFRQLLGELTETMAAAEDAHDEGTIDLLVDIRSKLEKHVWMLQSFVD